MIIETISFDLQNHTIISSDIQFMSNIIEQLKKVLTPLGVSLVKNKEFPEFSDYCLEYQGKIIGYGKEVENEPVEVGFVGYYAPANNCPFHNFEFPSELNFDSFIKGFQFAYSKDFFWYSLPNLGIMGYSCDPLTDLNSFTEDLRTFLMNEGPEDSKDDKSKDEISITIDDTIVIDLTDVDLDEEGFEDLELEDDDQLKISGREILELMKENQDLKNELEESEELFQQELFTLLTTIGNVIEANNKRWVDENWYVFSPDKKKILSRFENAEFDFVTLQGKVIIKENKYSRIVEQNLFGEDVHFEATCDFFIMDEDGKIEKPEESYFKTLLKGRFSTLDESVFKGFIQLP